MNQNGLEMDRKIMERPGKDSKWTEKLWKGLEMDRNRLKMDRAISKWTETNSK